MKSLEIFDFFKKFCKKNNLNFFICGGCCIGAIRHRGFIPWDDDIDIFMPREDYDKVFNLWDETKYICIDPSNSKIASHPFIKIVDTTTTLIKQEDIESGIRIGVAIDIFPLDGCPSSFVKRKLQIIFAMFYCLFSSKVIPKKYGFFVKCICFIVLSLGKIFKLNYKISKFCKNQMSKYEIKNCKKITELCAGPKYMFKEYPKEAFESYVLKEFENRLIELPIGYDIYLKTAFGNYKELPPKNKQKSDHKIIEMNLNKSFTKL